MHETYVWVHVLRGSNASQYPACQESQHIAPHQQRQYSWWWRNSIFSWGRRVVRLEAKLRNTPSQLETKERAAKGAIAQSWLTAQYTTHTYTCTHTVIIYLPSTLFFLSFFFTPQSVSCVHHFHSFFVFSHFLYTLYLSRFHIFMVTPPQTRFHLQSVDLDTSWTPPSIPRCLPSIWKMQPCHQQPQQFLQECDFLSQSQLWKPDVINQSGRSFRVICQSRKLLNLLLRIFFLERSCLRASSTCAVLGFDANSDLFYEQKHSHWN